MQRTAAIAFALLLSSSLLIAQSPTSSPAQLNFIVTAPMYTCPVGMRAQHAPDLHRVYVHGETRVESSAMQLKFVLTNRRPGQIVAANITVRGLNGKGQVVPTATASEASANLTKTIDASFAPGPDGNVTANLVLSGFTSVTSIELNSVTYANGATWKFAPRDACQVAPDPLMFIDAHMVTAAAK